jgi:hypothetical protein
VDPREIAWGVMDWIDLAYNGDQCRACVNTVMNLNVHKMLEISWVAAQLAAPREWLISMELVI